MPRTPISGWLTIGCSKRRASGEVALGADSLHPEEVPGVVDQVTRVRLEAPSAQRRERDPFDVAALLPAPLVQPAAGGGDVGETAFRGQGRGQETGPIRAVDWLRPVHGVGDISCTSRQ